MTRPFRVLGLQQVAMGARDKRDLESLWIDLLGLEVSGHFMSDAENVNETILSVGQGSARVEVDLMEPLRHDARPAVHEPPLNHIGLWVDDLKAAKQWLEGQGVRFAPGGIRKGAAGHDVCFIHPKGSADFPKSGGGVLIELVQAPSDLVESFGR